MIGGVQFHFLAIQFRFKLFESGVDGLIFFIGMLLDQVEQSDREATEFVGLLNDGDIDFASAKVLEGFGLAIEADDFHLVTRNTCLIDGCHHSGAIVGVEADETIESLGLEFGDGVLDVLACFALVLVVFEGSGGKELDFGAFDAGLKSFEAVAGVLGTHISHEGDQFATVGEELDGGFTCGLTSLKVVGSDVGEAFGRGGIGVEADDGGAVGDSLVDGGADRAGFDGRDRDAIYFAGEGIIEHFDLSGVIGRVGSVPVCFDFQVGSCLLEAFTHRIPEG